MDYRLFESQEEAERHAHTMRGWDTTVVSINAGEDMNNPYTVPVAWIICCDGDKYLRDDGYVR